MYKSIAFKKTFFLILYDQKFCFALIVASIIDGLSV